MADESAKASQPVTDFLNQLDEKESLVALQAAYTQKSHLYFKTEASESIVKCTIDSFVDRKVILQLENPDMPVTIDKEVSIKFNIGTEVYFVKTPIKKHLNLPCFDFSAKVIQLKRRKEPRYLIPKKWAQTAIITSSESSTKSIHCNVIDISNSGMRLEAKDVVPLKFSKDEIIKIQFQIHRRAEVSCDAIVRFFMNRLNHPTLLGLELVFNKDIDQERTSGVVEDIVSFQNGQKF